MTALVAATQDTAPPRVQITATDVPAGTATLYRLAEGQRAPVRGMVAATTSPTMIAVDSEAPFGVELSYELVVTLADGSTQETDTLDPVTMSTDLPWITHPITSAGVSLTITDWPEFTYTARQTVVPVAGRATPIVVSDVRTAPSSTMVVLTRTADQLKALRQLLATGDVLQARAVCGAVEDDYLSIGDVVETRLKPSGKSTDPVQAGSDWRRLVTLNVQSVDRPATAIPVVGDTLADLATYVPTTLGDLAVAFGADATLLTIAQTPLRSS